jgi:hypothetical protein
MIPLIIFTALILYGIYHVTTMDFEIGTGFTEKKKKARDAEYTIVERGEKADVLGEKSGG